MAKNTKSDKKVTKVVEKKFEKPVEVETPAVEQPKAKKVSYIDAVGRRKTSIARARLMDGKGLLTINGKPGEEYLKNTGITGKMMLEKPFAAIGRKNRFDISIKVRGGGVDSQLGAIVHAIARALDKYSPDEFHRLLRKHELLTRDPRMKERRKFGLMGARKHKSSPKR